MWVRKRLDIAWTDLLAGVRGSLFPSLPNGSDRLRDKLEQQWVRTNPSCQKQGMGFLSFSVRSAFDLYLQALDLPKGSEVLTGAITIPDMVRIIEKHGLIPVPIDIDSQTLLPELTLLEQAVSGKSRALLMTHLFGNRMDLRPFITFAQSHNLLLIEDCAQAFTSVNGHRGHEAADISFFSFGSIKTQTALGGALCRIKDAQVHRKMQRLQSAYPLQPRGEYRLKSVKQLLLKLVSVYPVYGLLLRLAKRSGINYDRQITRLTRGFAGGDFFRKIRRQPAPDLLKMLGRRLNKTNDSRIELRLKKGQTLDQLINNRIERPGLKSAGRDYWLYPIVCSNPGKVISVLFKNGFDATQGSSQLTWVKIPASIDPERAALLDPCGARRILMHTVYLPLYPELSDSALSRMAELVNRTACDFSALNIHEPGRDALGRLPNPGQKRSRTIAAMQDRHFDLLVAGGGINGGGIAREAALAGLSVALVEKNDYASGSSSSSAKLVHGGYRYLESFQIGLVAESCRSRYLQMKLNPHLVKAVPFVIPLFGKSFLKHAWLDFGLWLYDIIGRFKSPKSHRRVNRRKTAGLIPEIKKDQLKGSLVYYDGKADDARLTLFNISDAQHNGALTLNYTELQDVIFGESNTIQSARVRDNLTGQSFSIRADHLVYAGGASLSGFTFVPEHIIKPNKGIHIIISKARLKMDPALILKSPDDGRYAYCVPYHDVFLIGTTESDFDPAREKLAAGRQEVLYLLHTMQHHFPELELTEDDIHCTIAGLRPLLNNINSKKKINKILSHKMVSWVNKKNLVDNSRDYRIFSDARGITIPAGGKLTTYRNLACKVVEGIVEESPRNKNRTGKKSLSLELPLDFGLTSFHNDSAGSPQRRHLVEYYGSGYLWVEDRLRAFPAEQRLIMDGLPFVFAEISYLVFAEQAVHLDDVLIRRTGIFYRALDQGLSISEAAARHMAGLLEKDELWIDSEMQRYRELVDLSRGWKKEDKNPVLDK